MRKSIIGILFIFQSLILFAPGLKTVYISMPEPEVKIYTDIEKLQAIIYVETTEGENRYNPNEPEAVGLLQIWPIMIDDVNRILGYQKYQLSDRLSDKKSIEIFWIFQNHYNPSHNFEAMARTWNSGPDGMRETNSLNYYELAKYQLYNT
jgi:hypothetical protein